MDRLTAVAAAASGLGAAATENHEAVVAGADPVGTAGLVRGAGVAVRHHSPLRLQ